MVAFLFLNLKERNFTWSNGRDYSFMARLDQFLLSIEWKDLFPTSFQKALINTASFHVLIALECDIIFYILIIFRFEACWFKELDVDDVVHGN